MTAKSASAKETHVFFSPQICDKYQGEVRADWYGRQVPKHAHGTANLDLPTSSTRLITEAVLKVYDRVVNRELLVRRLNVTMAHVVHENDVQTTNQTQQLDLFTDYEALARQREEQEALLNKERRLQQAQLSIKQRFGKNAILRGINFKEGATAKDRNQQIGGHKA